MSVHVVSSRVPARRPGNFHLRAQMKVTKAKGLKYTFVQSAWLQTGAAFGSLRSLARFLPDPSSLRDFSGRKSSVLQVLGLFYRRARGSKSLDVECAQRRELV